MKNNKQIKVIRAVTIAVDLMGGDDSPDVRLDTVLAMLKSQNNIRLRVFVSRSYLNIISHKVSVLDKKLIEFIA